MKDDTTTITPYKIKAGTFEGPLELLLSLIEERKLFINEIALAEVTADYIGYLKSHPDLGLAHATSFINIAATLILIKSRSLLPNFSLTQEEEKNILDLEARLKLYQVIKEVGQEIKERFGKEVLFGAPERRVEEQFFVPDPQITLARMHEAIESVVEALPSVEKLQEVTVRKVVSLEEMISRLTDRITNTATISFKDFSKNPESGSTRDQKVYAIVSFLALLELVREGIIDVLQDARFADMTIAKQAPNVEHTI